MYSSTFSLTCSSVYWNVPPDVVITVSPSQASVLAVSETRSMTTPVVGSTQCWVIVAYWISTSSASPASLISDGGTSRVPTVVVGTSYLNS